MNAVADLGGSVATAPRSKKSNMQSTPALHNTAMHMPAMQYVIARKGNTAPFHNARAEDAEL